MDASEDVNVGKVVSAHGAAGGVRIQVLSDVPHRFDTGKLLHIATKPHRVSSRKPVRTGQLVLTFHGLNTRDDAQALVGHWITVPAADAPRLPEGEFFHFQLLGLRVVTEDGEELGRLTEIMETGSNDVYVVTGGGPELLLPAVSDVVKKVCLDQGVMVVHLLEGLR